MPQDALRTHATELVLRSLWSAARGEQVIDCELIVPGTGHAMLRCGFGPHAVIRSQFIASANAAVDLSETWKAALVEQGFQVVSRTDLTLPSAAVGRLMVEPGATVEKN